MKYRLYRKKTVLLKGGPAAAASPGGSLPMASPSHPMAGNSRMFKLFINLQKPVAREPSRRAHGAAWELGIL